MIFIIDRKGKVFKKLLIKGIDLFRIEYLKKITDSKTKVLNLILVVYDFEDLIQYICLFNKLEETNIWILTFERKIYSYLKKTYHLKYIKYRTLNDIYNLISSFEIEEYRSNKINF